MWKQQNHRVVFHPLKYPFHHHQSQSHCCRSMRLSSCERQIRIRIQCLKPHQVPGAVGCVAPDPGLVAELGKQLGDEIKEGRLGEKSRGVVVLLECLEKKAIMGEDQGRDPTDYNRRAQIFDELQSFPGSQGTETTTTATK